MEKYYTKFSYGSIVNVFEFDPSEELFPVVSVGDPNKRQVLTDIKHDWCEKQGYQRVAGVNLSFFSFITKAIPLGVDYRDSGITINSPASDPYFKGYELAFKNNQVIIGDFTQAYFASEIEKKANWAVSLSYSLVLNGKIDIKGHETFDHYKYRHPRTCIGQKANGTVVLCVIDGRAKKSLGVTAQQSAQIMLDLGCTKAINADGGGSSQMMYKNKLVNVCSDGPRGRAVANALLVYSKKKIVLSQSQYPVLRYGTNGDFVLVLQKALITKGYNIGHMGADGSFGLKTLAALKEYQAKNNLAVDGMCGPATWNKILN